jgi:hypothetical protein
VIELRGGRVVIESYGDVARISTVLDKQRKSESIQPKKRKTKLARAKASISTGTRVAQVSQNCDVSLRSQNINTQRNEHNEQKQITGAQRAKQTNERESTAFRFRHRRRRRAARLSSLSMQQIQNLANNICVVKTEDEPGLETKQKQNTKTFAEFRSAHDDVLLRRFRRLPQAALCVCVCVCVCVRNDDDE